MKRFDSQRFLTVYSGVLTIAVTVALTTGFSSDHRDPTFRSITVERINIVEPDGTLRMVLSNNDRLPGIIMHGKEYPDFGGRKASTAAGLLFYDAEGSESGGLTFGGLENEQGQISRFGHLSFDGYEQDQILTIDAVDDGRNFRSSIKMIDRPEWSIVDYLELLESIQNLPPEEQQPAIDEFLETHPLGPGVRMVLSNENYPDAPSLSRTGLQFNDSEARERLDLGLGSAGDPSVELLDETGNIVDRMPSTD